MSRTEAEALVREAVDQAVLERGAAETLAAHLSEPEVRECVAEAALESKKRGKGDVVTVSRNAFVPLTNLCRNRCGYCTFAKLPGSEEAKTLRLKEVKRILDKASKVGCTEALFCLGDKPEIAYHGYRDWLASEGYATTAEYLVDACRQSFDQGILPHTNAGILTKEELTCLRPWNASLGLMLETTSPRLRQRGLAHYYAPDKEPSLRIQMHEEAGELGIAFTTGLLLGIGETAQERVDTLFVIRELQERFGHLQEVILQPFHAKPDTAMAGVPGLPETEVAAWAGLARLILGPDFNIQAPPNLSGTDATLRDLLRAGINDWGGISPLTQDYINPEAPWPSLERLRRVTEEAGQKLRERLPAYPEFIRDRAELFDPNMLARLRELADTQGFARPRNGGSAEEAA